MAKQGTDIIALLLVVVFAAAFIGLYYNEQKRKVVHEAFASGNLPNPMPQMPTPPTQ